MFRVIVINGNKLKWYKLNHDTSSYEIYKAGLFKLK